MPLLSVFVLSSNTGGERRLHSELTVAQLKDKLFPVTGITPQYQVLSLYRSMDAAETRCTPIASLSNEVATLENYGVQDMYCIKVDNTDPTARPGEFTDVSAVDKFELTDSEYAARRDTVQAHLKANKLGKYADVPVPIAFSPPTAIPSDVVVGARCEVQGEIERRGTIRFVGETTFGKGGVWVGVELDEPMRKGDGSVDGTRYFQCLPKYASFVRVDKVKVGDFPEEDLMTDDDDEI
ncbi:hypothetical protein CspHIS471_0401240 [Cutaneotrichosporon sp. HIS471]|nr:hypothetical protein CspHIS471_0401240 [Cutaneotrichosporon sp. HIS471]